MKKISQFHCKTVNGGNNHFDFRIGYMGFFFGLATATTLSALESYGNVDSRNPLHLVPAGTALGLTYALPSLLLFLHLS